MAYSQIIVNSLIIGSIYALVASGFSLIYATNRFMHFAHGVSIAVSGYVLFTLFTLLSLPFSVSCIFTIFFTGLFGWSCYRFIYLPMQGRKASNVVLLIASLGILILFQNVIQLFYGASVKSIGFLKVVRGVDILGATITPLQMVIIILSLVLFAGLHLFMLKTKLGRDMRAVADNKELASIVGIDYKKVAGASFFIGSSLAGVAGILIGLERNLTPIMGTDLMVKGFTGAVIGGITSVPGSILGSLLLGFAENFGMWYLPSGYKDAIAFGLLFIFLLFRPQGLFGIDKGVKQ